MAPAPPANEAITKAKDAANVKLLLTAAGDLHYIAGLHADEAPRLRLVVSALRAVAEDGTPQERAGLAFWLRP